MKHPCLVQIRDVDYKKLEDVVNRAGRFNVEVSKVKNGVDIYFDDVNDARVFISNVKKIHNFSIKFSTRFAGVRGGRVRVLFVYCLRGQHF
ncbi:MAG: hypothetical protein DRP01_07965 [Archaeoglobales archaeon]|nr:MAG: hypothetical protein DRP01_07965 [Archaeoglobales archaeon]